MPAPIGNLFSHWWTCAFPSVRSVNERNCQKLPQREGQQARIDAQ
jgi:hypothetical protein